MKSFSFCATFALSVFVAGFASAQSSNVCVIDVATVFKSNEDFNSQLKVLQGEAEQYKVYLQSEVTKLQSLAEQLKTKNVNSPEYTQLENAIAQANASLAVGKNTKTRLLVQREAKLHFDTYVKTTNAVATLCNQRNIRMVLQYSSIPMSLENPESIMQRVNSEIIYHSPQKDITQDVIAILNQSQGQRVGNVPANNR